MRLDGPRSAQLADALKAFNVQELASLLQDALNVSLEDIVGPFPGANRSVITRETIGWFNRRNTVELLILAARQTRPDDEKLLQIAQQYDLAVGGQEMAKSGGLERLLTDVGSFLDVAVWRQSLGILEGQVCRIWTPFGGGTGFLVSGDLVLTNYHVIEALQIKGTPADAAKCEALFDYKRSDSTGVVQRGVPFRLAGANDGSWLVFSSAYHEFDLSARTLGEIWPEDRLDFALIRLEGTPGAQRLGDSKDANAPPRGFIRLPDQNFDFPSHYDPGDPLLILQHPRGAPLKLSIRSDGLIGGNANLTRIRYRNDTLEGSSGSPCFNQNWECIALHHSGDPDWSPGHQPQYNQGIPIVAIRRLLNAHGKGDLLD